MLGSSTSTGRESVGGLGYGKLQEGLKQPALRKGLISFFILIRLVIAGVVLLMEGMEVMVMMVMEMMGMEMMVMVVEVAEVMVMMEVLLMDLAMLVLMMVTYAPTCQQSAATSSWCPCRPQCPGPFGPAAHLPPALTVFHPAADMPHGCAVPGKQAPAARLSPPTGMLPAHRSGWPLTHVASALSQMGQTCEHFPTVSGLVPDSPQAVFRNDFGF